MAINLEDEVIVDWAIDNLIENRLIYLHTEDGFPIGAVLDWDTLKKLVDMVPEEKNDELREIWKTHKHIGDRS